MKKSFFIIKKNNLYVFYMYFIFFIFELLYFIIFAMDLNLYENDEGFFQKALNIHDHLVYFENVLKINDNEIVLGINNDIGIAYIYHYLLEIIPFLDESNIALVSFIFNNIIFIFTLILYIKICDILKLNIYPKIIFFLGFQFLYFLQLINKDLLTIFVFMLLIYLGYKKKYFVIILIMPIMALIRLQMIFLFFYYICIMIFSKKPILNLFFLYLFSSMISAYLSIKLNFISGESLGNGISALIHNINFNYYYLGNLVFNPIRLIQMLQDIFMSFSFNTDNAGIDVAKILRIPLLVIFLYYFKYIIRIFTQYRYWYNSEIKPVLSLIIAYILVLLMNPTINARYVMLILPIIFIFVFYVKKSKRRVIIS